MEHTSSVTSSMLARLDGTSITGCAQYHQTSNPLKFSRYDIHFHRSPRVPIGLCWRSPANQVLQPQGVDDLFVARKYSIAPSTWKSRTDYALPKKGGDASILPPRPCVSFNLKCSYAARPMSCRNSGARSAPFAHSITHGNRPYFYVANQIIGSSFSNV